MFRQRIQVRFARRGTIRFVAHKDLMRIFERALRRTGLPLRLTSGFNRHPRLSFPLPLAVGWEGLNEVMEFELETWVPARELADLLAAQLPPGLDFLSATLARESTPAQAVEAEFQVTPISDEVRARVAQDAAERFMAAKESLVERLRKERIKIVNVRPFVRNLEVRDGQLLMQMAVSAEGTTKPEEVLAGIGFSKDETTTGFRIIRTRVRLKVETTGA
jgi:radical SAM-linked protein